jgi:hypothetical protein
MLYLDEFKRRRKAPSMLIHDSNRDEGANIKKRKG